MKKIVFLPLIVLLFCGCSPQKTVAPALNNICFTANIVYDQQNYIAEGTMRDSNLNLTVTAPEEIKGLTLDFDNNGFTAQFNGISYAPDIDSLPQGAIIQILFDILNDAVGETINISNQNCKVTDNVNGYEYVFTFSPSGLPISLEVDDLNLSVEFYNVTLK